MNDEQCFVNHDFKLIFVTKNNFFTDQDGYFNYLNRIVFSLTEQTIQNQLTEIVIAKEKNNLLKEYLEALIANHESEY